MTRMQGVVKFFNPEGHYGFLCLLDESGDVVLGEYFFHGINVIGALPEKGDTVNFILDDPPSLAQRRDLIAVDVEKVTRSTITFAPAIFEKDRTHEREVA